MIRPPKVSTGITPQSAERRLISASGGEDFFLYTPISAAVTVVNNPENTLIPPAFISDPKVLHPIGVTSYTEPDQTMGDRLFRELTAPTDAVYYPTTDSEYVVQSGDELPDEYRRRARPKLPDGERYYTDEEALRALRLARVADFLRELEGHASESQVLYETRRDDLLHSVACGYDIDDERMIAADELSISLRGLVKVRLDQKEVLHAISLVTDGPFYYRSKDFGKIAPTMIYDTDVNEGQIVDTPLDPNILKRTAYLDQDELRRKTREILVDSALTASLKQEAADAKSKLEEIQELVRIAYNMATPQVDSLPWNTYPQQARYTNPSF